MTCAPRFRRLFLCVLVYGFHVGVPLHAQTRMIITTGAVCRAEPRISAAHVHTYQLGDLLNTIKETEAVDGTWYFDQWQVRGLSPSCWIYGPLTTEFMRSNPEAALVALMDHILQRPNEARFEDYVAAENLFSDKRFATVAKFSGLLQFRKLSIITQAISRNDARGHELEKDPLKKAWVLSHGDLVHYYDPDAEWYVFPESYWSLYEQYKQAPWAEDLAWAAAQLHIPGDECYADCLLGAIDRTFLQYWTRYPRGYAIRQALVEATHTAEAAADVACFDKDTDYSVPLPRIEKLRGSLADVVAPEKTQLLDYLEQIERKCYPSKG
jgi:hypothetical protein